jgi:hypothetical protein
MTDPTRIEEPETEPFWRSAAPTARVPVPRASRRPPADWGRRAQAALFVFLCLVIANVAVADWLLARHVLGWP